MQKEPFEPKKLAPLRILEILKEGSDEAHPMTQTEIAERLERDFGIVLERKAVARNLQMLGDAGYASRAEGSAGSISRPVRLKRRNCRCS